MKKQLSAKVPLPHAPLQPTISCDGTIGMDLPLLFDMDCDRDIEEEEWTLFEDVREVVLDMLDRVEDIVDAGSVLEDEDFEF